MMWSLKRKEEESVYTASIVGRERESTEFRYDNGSGYLKGVKRL
jgi:hypothetical protein